MKKQLFFYLKSPYKLGTGWSLSSEEHDKFDAMSREILSLIGHKEVKNNYDVPEGEADGERAYMHPREYAIKLTDENRIPVIVEAVKRIAEVNKHFIYKITAIQVKDLQTGEYTTLEGE